jgi:nucleotide-binding universal stress UspA family protein
MYEKLLMAVDHSAATSRVVAAAKDLAALSQGEVWVLTVREHEVVPRAGIMPKESMAAANAAVDAVVADLTRAGVKAHGEVRNALYGHAAREIVDAAEAHEAGVIVMGTKGRGDLAGLVLGSTAHKVLHLADRPVLVIR